MKAVPAELPVFFIYGKEDPVGGYGKTIENQVLLKYKKHKQTD